MTPFKLITVNEDERYGYVQALRKDYMYSEIRIFMVYFARYVHDDIGDKHVHGYSVYSEDEVRALLREGDFSLTDKFGARTHWCFSRMEGWR